MRLLRRNTRVFAYRPLTGEEEVLENGMHTGRYQPSYGEAVEYRGNISAPTGYASDQYFGKNTQYSHILLMDNPKADIKEYGLIEWQGDTYEIRQVSPSINVLAIALKKQTKNHAEDEPDGGEGQTGEGVNQIGDGNNNNSVGDVNSDG